MNNKDFIKLLLILGAIQQLNACGGGGSAVENSSVQLGENDVNTEGCAIRISESEQLPAVFQNSSADCDYYLESGGILRNASIEAGTTILMGAGASLDVTDDAITASGIEARSLQALGTSALPITIRGAKDEPGFWHGISAFQATMSLEYVTIDGAGGLDERGVAADYAVSLFESVISINDSSITNSLTGGLDLNRSSFTSFGNNVFSGNGASGLSIFIPPSNSIIDFLDVDTDYVGIESPNGNPYVKIRPSSAFASFKGRFRDINTVYRVDDLIVQQEDLLTIDAGVEIVLEERAIWRIQGTLAANGTEEAPISISAVPNIEGSFTSLSLSNTSTMSYVNISGGGYGAALGGDVGAIVVGASTRLSNVTVRNSTGYAISCGSFPTTILQFENETFENNQLGDIHPHCTVLD